MNKKEVLGDIFAKINFVIVGASISGLVTALTLEKVGINYKIYEREDESRDPGAGVDMEKSVKPYLEYLGVDSSKFIPIFARKYLNSKDELIYESLKIRDAIAWKDLFLELLSKINKKKVFFCHTVKSLSEYITQEGLHKIKLNIETSEGVQVFDECDYLIGSDGINSVVRKHVAPEKKLKYTGYVAVRGCVDVSQLETFNNSEKDKDYFITAFFKKYNQLPNALYFNVSENMGTTCFYMIRKNVVNWMWYYNTEEPSVNKFTFDPSMEFEKKVREDAASTWDEEVNMLIKYSKIFITSIYDRELLDQFVYGHIILCGDSAHLTRPHGGQAISMAVKDAYFLKQALEKSEDVGMEKALQEFNQLRVEETQFKLLQSRKFGKLLQKLGDFENMSLKERQLMFDLDFREWN